MPMAVVGRSAVMAIISCFSALFFEIMQLSYADAQVYGRWTQKCQLSCSHF